MKVLQFTIPVAHDRSVIAAGKPALLLPSPAQRSTGNLDIGR